MRVLVTAGNTQVPIDRVRCLTNIFTGRTGAAIALAAHDRGHDVTLLTSHPDVVPGLHPHPLDAGRWRCHRYATFDDLRQWMADEIQRGYDVVIHSAAVSDYLAAGVYAPTAGTRFNEETLRWSGDAPALVDRAAAKVKSDEAELWLRLVRAPKLVDMVRRDWGFAGVLVKFKLEVEVTEERLLAIAEASRRHSDADLMVANTLEGAPTWAYVGPTGGGYQRVARRDLAERLLAAIALRIEERGNG